MTLTEQPRSYLDRIAIDPDVMVGRPTIRGTHIPVELVLEHLADRVDLSDLLESYPRLTEEDVRACLLFACRSVRAQFNPELDGEWTIRDATHKPANEESVESLDFDGASFIPPSRFDRITLVVTNKPAAPPSGDVEDWLE